MISNLYIVERKDIGEKKDMTADEMKKEILELTPDWPNINHLYVADFVKMRKIALKAIEKLEEYERKDPGEKMNKEEINKELDNITFGLEMICTDPTCSPGAKVTILHFTNNSMLDIFVEIIKTAHTEYKEEFERYCKLKELIEEIYKVPLTETVPAWT
jgi:uncharacterized protein YqfB (UPF0267 family)